VRREIARLFGLVLDEVRLHVPFLGGGFGSKSYTTVEPLVCTAAWLTGSPVKLVNTVEESMQTSRQHNMRCRMLTAISGDGELLVRSARILMDTGAYATNGPTITFFTGVAAPGPYAWRAVDVNAKCVYTTRSPSGSYRGFGSSHTQWISEMQLDEVAAMAGMERMELRRRNLLRRGDLVHPRLGPLDADLSDSFEKVLSALPPPPAAAPGTRVGVGVGFGVIPAGADPSANALARIRSDGRVKVLVGSTEIGQGARTVFAQIAAEVLEVPVESIEVPGADTSTTPFDRSTGASRSTTLVGLAVERAARDVVAQLSGLAVRLLPTGTGEVTYAGRTFSRDGEGVSFDEVVALLGPNGDEIVGRGRVGIGEDSTSFPVYWEVCAAGAVVSVDEATGKVTVLHTVGVPDVGRAINPRLVAVQDSGCTIQALGHTLLEELEFGDDGELLTPSLVQYRVPTTDDIPHRMDCELVENQDGPGPFGAKGCGEGAFGAVPAAIMTGLLDAGVRVVDLPATPERVWASLHPEEQSADEPHTYRALA
jgi:CO/xanthine dehydrogenase Mo-binding subunit